MALKNKNDGFTREQILQNTMYTSQQQINHVVDGEISLMEKRLDVELQEEQSKETESESD